MSWVVEDDNGQTAMDLGRRLLFHLEQRAEQGLPAQSKSFAAVIEDYIRLRTIFLERCFQLVRRDLGIFFAFLSLLSLRGFYCPLFVSVLRFPLCHRGRYLADCHRCVI